MCGGTKKWKGVCFLRCFSFALIWTEAGAFCLFTIITSASWGEITAPDWCGHWAEGHKRFRKCQETKLQKVVWLGPIWQDATWAGDETKTLSSHADELLLTSLFIVLFPRPQTCRLTFPLPHTRLCLERNGWETDNCFFTTVQNHRESRHQPALLSWAPQRVSVSASRLNTVSD